MASDVTNYLKRIYDLIESQSMRLQRGTSPILLDAATNTAGTNDASIALESIDLGLAELFTTTSVTNNVPE